jgi:hypothetical protein
VTRTEIIDLASRKGISATTIVPYIRDFGSIELATLPSCTSGIEEPASKGV